jgi:D-aspartate ligase
MKRISVLIPDADVQFHVACCLTLSRQAVVHGFALHPAPSLKYSRFYASFEEYKGKFDLEVWLRRIGEIVAERQIDVVLPMAEFAIRTLSEHRHALPWGGKLTPLPNPYTLDIATNKVTFAEFLRKSSIPHPPTIVVAGGSPGVEAFSTIKFPVLAKPPVSCGGVGIRRFEGLESLVSFLAAQPSDQRWVVQSFIEGSDLSVNVLCQAGRVLAATVQHAIRPPSKSYQTASGIAFRGDTAAMKVAETLVRELGWSGVANIDMRFDALHKMPLVLEINGRYWFTLLGSLNAGVNFPLLASELSLGELKANRKPRVARYFSGKDSVLLSLAGGGSLRIRPWETNLRYLDPLPTAFGLAQSAAKRVRKPFSRLFDSASG